MRRLVLILLGVTLGGAPASAAEPLKVFSLPPILEAAPLLIAVEKSAASDVVGMPGGIPNLWEGEVVRFPGLADVAGNAETQALRFSLKHPDLRVILTVTEGLYRIVARRSAGIASLADLKGKRVATQADTSAAYYLKSALAAGQLAEADLQIVASTPAAMADALIARQIDAIAIWEPQAERAALALGADAVSLRPNQPYREFYSLNTTAAALADPTKRAQIVAFVRTLIGACRDVAASPERAQALYAARSGNDAAVIRSAWPHHRFSCSLPAELADIMAQEEQWMAGLDKRAPRTREEIAKLIDASVLNEAMQR